MPPKLEHEMTKPSMSRTEVLTSQPSGSTERIPPRPSNLDNILTQSDKDYLKMIEALLAKYDMSAQVPQPLYKEEYDTLHTIVESYFKERGRYADERATILRNEVSERLKAGRSVTLTARDRANNPHILSPVNDGQYVAWQQSFDRTTNKEVTKVVRINPGELPRNDELRSLIRTLERQAATDAAWFLSTLPKRK